MLVREYELHRIKNKLSSSDVNFIAYELQISEKEVEEYFDTTIESPTKGYEKPLKQSGIRILHRIDSRIYEKALQHLSKLPDNVARSVMHA